MGIVQAVDHLSSMHEALNSIPSTTHKKKDRKRKREKGRKGGRKERRKEGRKSAKNN
jgi:hypothetical protein